MRIWIWLRSWFEAAKVYRHVSIMSRKLDRAGAQCEAYLQRVQEFRNKVESDVVEFQHFAREAERAQRQYEAVIESVRTESDVYKIGIETLTFMHKALCARYAADMAIQERRKVAVSLREE